MSIDWSPLKPFVNYLTVKLLILLVMMLVCTIITVFVCDLIRIPRKITSSVTGLACLYGGWLWVKWFLG